MSGRKRHAKNFPAHIDRDKLPKGIYWDSSGNGHWYTSFFDGAGKQRRVRVAGPKAAMSDLHRIKEAQEGIRKDTFDFIAEKFFESPDFNQLAAETKKGYRGEFRKLSGYPTKRGTRLGGEPLSNWSLGMVQRLVDRLTANNGPTAANHSARFGRRVFNWACQREYAVKNPYHGVKMAKERKKRTLPSRDAYLAVLEYSKTTSFPYMWAVMELAYLCRLRGAEVLDLTDASESAEGLYVVRRKGSRPNVVKWNPRLERAWKSLKERRKHIQNKRGMPLQIDENQRFVIVSRRGGPLTRSALSTAWQKVIKGAIKSKTIDENARFSLHDLKRMGVTNTKGTRSEKQQASGHRSSSMMDVYDMEIPVVDAADGDV